MPGVVDSGRADPRPGSWWLRRRDGQLVFERPSSVEGRLWGGCVLDGAVWIGTAGGVVGGLRDFGPRHHLAEALAVAEVDEDHAPEVAAGGRPAHERHRLPDVLRAEGAGVMRAREVPERLSQRSSP